jgi:hypothetical protein
MSDVLHKPLNLKEFKEILALIWLHMLILYILKILLVKICLVES